MCDNDVVMRRIYASLIIGISFWKTFSSNICKTMLKISVL